MNHGDACDSSLSRIRLSDTCVHPDVSLKMSQPRTGHLIGVANSSGNALSLKPVEFEIDRVMLRRSRIPLYRCSNLIPRHLVLENRL